ncbi:MAG: IS1634 family transposase, partial [Bacteroidia bacterium]|nr:IS1634 family transposase [Bacteroidia bacterium]
MEYSSKDLSHLGLVAGMCDKLELVSELDRLLPSEHSLSNGTCVKALILNGLGFVERRLYLVPQFFEDKPVSHLLGEGIEAPMLNDDRLGRCLDALYESGVSELFAHLSGRAAKILGLDQAPGWGFGHLDNTRFHVDGAYNRALDGEQVEDCLHICQGYSRDHRPDLNQVMLQLVVEHSAGIPLQMAALSGNSHDGVSFRQTISDYIGALDQQAEKRCWVMDSAFYNAQTIEMVGQQSYWISRVPATLAEVQSLKAQIGQAQM